MIFEKQITGSRFVFSKDELPYSEVLDDFKNAKCIYVLTYNISQRQHELIDALMQSNATEICIVTNIPARWEQYFGTTYAEKAQKTITLYKSRLALENSALSVYFNFSNHAKIIMTDKIVYVGSANYSMKSGSREIKPASQLFALSSE